jgi:hypothetical protein
MLYTPVPGTPLYAEMSQQGRTLDVDYADIHGQWKFNFRHAAISHDDSKRLLDAAFRLDFERNGPSLFRICETIFRGWQRHHDSPDPRVRERMQEEARKIRTTYNAALWAMERRLKKSNPAVSERMRALRREIEQQFGLPTRLLRVVGGPLLTLTSKIEDRRLAHGQTYEPKTFVERRNWDAKVQSLPVGQSEPEEVQSELAQKQCAVASVGVNAAEART